MPGDDRWIHRNAPSHTATGRGELILVVDDEPVLIDLFRATLDASGYRTLTAANGEEALAVAASRLGELSAAIVDLTMPIMDGFETIRSIRRLAPGLPILAMSGSPDRQTVDESEVSGVYAFLAKPFSAEELLSRLREALGQGTS